MLLRKDVYELLRLYEGTNPREAFKPTVVVTPLRDRRDNVWITEDPKAGRHPVFRSQVPDRLEPAYDIALSEGLFEQSLLKPKDQIPLYESHGMPVPPQDKPWPVVPANSATLVVITNKGRAAIARYTTKSPILSERLKVDVIRRTITLDGVVFDKIESEPALRWVKVLTQHPEEWISSSNLHKYDRDLLTQRTDKLKKFLPAKVLDQIESVTGSGSRLRRRRNEDVVNP